MLRSVDFFILALGCLLLSACDKPDDYVYPPGSWVPVEPSAGNSLSYDMNEIVVTDLYHYPKRAVYDERFIADGPPLSFAFPAAAYPSFLNRLGGPQWNIYLTLDRETSNPFAQAILETAGSSGHRGRWKAEDSLRHRKIFVSVRSNLSSSIGGDDRQLLDKRVKGDRINICGFEFGEKTWPRKRADDVS